MQHFLRNGYRVVQRRCFIFIIIITINPTYMVIRNAFSFVKNLTKCIIIDAILALTISPYSDYDERKCTPLILLSGNAKLALHIKICFIAELEQRHHFCREHLTFKFSQTGKKFSTDVRNRSLLLVPHNTPLLLLSHGSRNATLLLLQSQLFCISVLIKKALQ